VIKNMTGWNPRDPNIQKEEIDIVNEFWWSGTMNRATTINTVINRLAREILFRRRAQNTAENQTKFLLKLLDELGKFPIEFSNKATLGNDKETFDTFNEYVRFVTNIANKRLDIFKKDAQASIASV